MKRIISILSLRREERIPALVALLIMTMLHLTSIHCYWDVFSRAMAENTDIFGKTFMVSGFDPITYSVLTNWFPSHDIIRHPLLGFMLWPLSMLNNGIMMLCGINLCQITAMAVIIFSAFYAFIFMHRILKELIGLGRFDSTLLSVLLFSFSHIMVGVCIPDHFTVSMFLLLLTIYICGRRMKENRKLTMAETTILFIITAGVTLSNGIKTFIYALFTNGKSFFRIKYLIGAVILPSLAIWCFAQWEHSHFRVPLEEQAKKEAIERGKIEKEKLLAAFNDTTTISDSTERAKVFKALHKKKINEKYRRDHRKPWNMHKGKPMSKARFLNMTDISTPRMESLYENIFGEGLILHQDYLLQDTLKSRPVIVPYKWWWNYVVEAILVAMMLIGLWAGRKYKLIWMIVCGVAFDFALHLGLGFGLNEVYIMTAHWAFIIPIAIGFAIKALKGKLQYSIRVVTLFTTLYLLIYNGWLITSYFLL